MANYSSIDEIVAGVANATQLRSNTRIDDGSDGIAGADYFTYGGNAVEKIYLNGNSYIGFGTDTADLKVNNRDNAMWNNWREEGKLNGVRFLRVRWGGYASYNTQYDQYKQTFDVLMFETGDICLYMVDIPTSNNTGAYALGSQTYTAPTAANRWVSFYKTETGFEIKYEPISLVPVLVKYLVKNEDTIYTVTDGALSEVTGELNAALFTTYGVDTIPAGDLLMTLAAPTVLCWTDGSDLPELTATVQGTPVGLHGITSDNIDLTDDSICGIASAEVVASDGATFVVSFDGGAWLIYTDGNWSEWNASIAGMTGAELAAIPETAWNSKVATAEYMQVRAMIDGEDTVAQVKFNFDNDLTEVQESEG